MSNPRLKKASDFGVTRKIAGELQNTLTQQFGSVAGTCHVTPDLRHGFHQFKVEFDNGLEREQHVKVAYAVRDFLAGKFEELNGPATPEVLKAPYKPQDVPTPV